MTIVYKRLILFFLAVLLVSCASRSVQRFTKLSNAASKDNYLSAVSIIRKNEDLYGKTNRYLYFMDIGVLFHYAGYYDSSSTHLATALQVYNDLYAKSVTNETASLLTNDNIRPYRSRPYELIFTHQLLALNYMARGKFDESLVETRQAQLLFDEWERQANGRDTYISDGMFHYMSSIAYDAVDEIDNSLISLFKSLQAYQSGPISAPKPIKNIAAAKFQQHGREADIKTLKLSPDDNASNITSDHGSEIILIGYAGKGPALEEVSWWGTWVRDGVLVVNYNGPGGKVETISMASPMLPQSELKKASKGRKTKSGTTLHIKFAMPSLRTFPSNTSYFNLHHDSLKTQVSSYTVNNLDEMLAQNLRDTRTTTLTRTVIRVVLRTIASQKTKDQLSGSNPLANLLLNIGTDVLADQLEHADVRSCFLIPKTVQVARLPVQAGTHTVTVTAHNRSGGVLSTHTYDNIKVGPHQKQVIFYSSLK